jgi:tRNA(Ile)-lysidine synthase
MLEKLHNHIVQNFPFLMEKKTLLATSGGLDSMVLLFLFQKLKGKIAVAHCNFQLRGNESNEDEKFVQNYVNQHQIKAFFIRFDTEKYAKINKLSTQVAARNLRYVWFNEIAETEKYDYILTAHHADDNLETFLINLSRGTGIGGLIGIPAKNEKIIRPLLIFSRAEIESFANKNNIVWREDSSNASDKYLRNKIRHQVLPKLKNLSPQFLDSFQKTQTHLQETQIMANNAIDFMFAIVAKKIESEIHYDIKILKTLPNFKTYLYHFLKDYNFTAWEDIYDLIDAQTGKQIFSNEFCLLKNRNFLILSPKTINENESEYFIQNDQEFVNVPLNLSICKVNDIETISKKTIFVDADKLTFPLVIKRWFEGSTFQPLGLNGQSQKLSKFFKDKKLSLIEKQNIWILFSDNQIVWIIGLRQDERFKIDKTTKNIFKITLL